MVDNPTQTVNFSLKGVSEALSLIVQIVEAAKKLPNFPELRRAEVRESLARSCQLVLQMLGDLRNELSDVRKLSEKFPDAARSKLTEIDSVLRWEEKHRALMLCYELDITQKKLGKAILDCMPETASPDRLAFDNV